LTLPSWVLDHNAKQHITISAGDLAEVTAAGDPTDEIVAALAKGAKTVVEDHGKDFQVGIYADDLFHVLEKQGVAFPAEMVAAK
jgi:hypothetical protein